MKTNKLILATSAMVVATLVSVAIVSCKKENTNALQDNNSRPAKAFAVPDVDDMNAYLKDFKQKMLESKSSEPISVDEAEWHLSSLLNYDFANANVECDDVRFDTIFNTVTISDCAIQLGELAQAYERIRIDIDRFYQSLMLENKHFRFVDCSITEDGVVTVTIITTSSTNSKWHYFADSTFCDYYFPFENYSYSEATSELQRVFNVVLGKDTIPSQTRTYYVKTRSHVYYFKNWLEDPDNYCPNEFHYRLFCTKGYFYGEIPQADICYYLDSYCGLANDNCYYGESVVCGTVEFREGVIPEYEGLSLEIEEQLFGHHLLTVGYGWDVHANQNGY